jgi:hypothetical protein
MDKFEGGNQIYLVHVEAQVMLLLVSKFTLPEASYVKEKQ